jgi:hypothetical protein
VNLEIILHAGLATGTVLLFASIGEMLTERSGILNLGVEGMMLIGAMTGFSMALATGNPWLGLLLAMLAAGVLSLAHGIVTISFQADQVVSGLALTFLGTGLALVLGNGLTGQNAPLIPNYDIALLASIPFIGPRLLRGSQPAGLSGLHLHAAGLVLHRKDASRPAPARRGREARGSGHDGRQRLRAALFLCLRRRLSGWAGRRDHQPVRFAGLVQRADHFGAGVDRHRSGDLRPVESAARRARRLSLWRAAPGDSRSARAADDPGLHQSTLHQLPTLASSCRWRPICSRSWRW